MIGYIATRLAWLLSVLVLVAPVNAQQFPNRALRIIVPFPAGGGSDNQNRALAQTLAQVLGQPVIVENRAGAGGNIGAEAAARAAPDGYTLFNCNIATHGISPAVYKKLPFDAEKDFAPISTFASTPNVLVVNPTVPARTVPEYLAWAKAGAGKIGFASSGVGTSPDMAMLFLKLSTGIDLVRISYKGGAPAQQDVIAGHVPTMFGSVGELAASIKSGLLRPIAVSSLKRHPSLPDVPSFDEAGVSGYQVVSWNHLCAPAGVPEPILDALNTAVVKAINSPELRDRMSRMGVVAEPSTRKELGAFINGELAKWRKVAQSAGIALD